MYLNNLFQESSYTAWLFNCMCRFSTFSLVVAFIFQTINIIELRQDHKGWCSLVSHASVFSLFLAVKIVYLSTQLSFGMIIIFFSFAFSGHGSIASGSSSEYVSKPVPGPRMPDGTRGFTMGRGKPVVSCQESSAWCMKAFQNCLTTIRFSFGEKKRQRSGFLSMILDRWSAFKLDSIPLVSSLRSLLLTTFGWRGGGKDFMNTVVT